MMALELNKRIIELPEVKLALYESQLGRDTRLICVHGGPGLDHASLLPGIAKLSEQFDLTFLDLRGHGKSSDPLNSDFSLDSYAGDIQHLALNYPKQRLGLFGHSFGGSVTLRALANSPKVFTFGVLCNSPIDSEYQKTSGAAVDKLVTDRSKDKIYSKFGADRHKDESYRSLMMDLGPMYFPEWSRNKIEEQMGTWTFRVKPYNSAVEHIFPNLNSAADCSKIAAPVLIISGRLDELIPWSHVMRFKNALRNSTLIQVEGGHFPFASGADNFCEQIFQWWKIQRKA